MPNLPKPTVLKGLQGTTRPDRMRADEPKGAKLGPETPPPAWVRGPVARRAWHGLLEMAPSGLLEQQDQAALGLLVNAFARYLAARDVVDGKACGLCGDPITSRESCTSQLGAHEPGRPYYTTTTKEGSLMIRRHPAASEALEWHEKVVGLLARFGMTPADKTRVGTGAPAGAADPVADFLGARRTS